MGSWKAARRLRVRDAGIRRGGNTGGDAGNDFPLDSGFDENLGLLASAPEYEWVSALQAGHRLAQASALDS